jgi:hypothetical protein
MARGGCRVREALSMWRRADCSGSRQGPRQEARWVRGQTETPRITPQTYRDMNAFADEFESTKVRELRQ